ncbi:LCP family protein [Streptomyces sp. NPDC050504]|uniref:LCP family protein n=1 Tax=Streptomyces sp. NPDC050504 TaxID=3365618 RepID=UPI0037A91B58
MVLRSSASETAPTGGTRFRRRSGTVLLGALALGLAVGAVPAGGLSGLPTPKDGLNLLVVGTDGRDTITRQEKQRYRLGGVACNCTDVMMLVHVAARGDRVSVVGLPRDSYARLPEHRDERTGELHPEHASKINGAYAEGGSDLSARTVELMTGLRVDRVLQVDFRRFMDSVNSIGGVPVCTAKPLKDSVTALNLAKGAHRLSGGRALQYVRSRHVDASADLGRIKRQQRFVLALGQELRDRLGKKGVSSFASVLVPKKSAGRALASGEIVDLAYRLRGLTPSEVEFAIVPISGFNDNRDGTGSTLQWDEEAAARIFAELGRDRPLPKKTEPQHPGHPILDSYKPVSGSSLDCR